MRGRTQLLRRTCRVCKRRPWFCTLVIYSAQRAHVLDRRCAPYGRGRPGPEGDRRLPREPAAAPGGSRSEAWCRSGRPLGARGGGAAAHRGGAQQPADRGRAGDQPEHGWRRVGLLQEAQDNVVELGRLLPIGGVAGAADDVVARAGDEPMAHLDEVRRRDLVVLADEEEDGQAGGVQALVDGEAWRRAGRRWRRLHLSRRVKEVARARRVEAADLAQEEVEVRVLFSEGGMDGEGAEAALAAGRCRLPP